MKNQLPLGTRIFVAAIIGGGACIAGVSLAFASFPEPALLVVLLFVAALTCVLVNLPASLMTRTMTATAAFSIELTTLLVLGPNAAVLVAVAGAWSRASFRGPADTPVLIVLFKVASRTIAMQAAGLVYVNSGGRVGSFEHWLWALPFAGASLTLFAITSAFRAGLKAATTPLLLRRVWKQSLGWAAPAWLLASCIAPACAVMLSRSSLWLFPLAAGSLLCAYLAHRNYVRGISSQEGRLREASGLQLATIEALAIAIGAKDRTDPAQIRREQLYAALLARDLGLPEEEIQAVTTAALLHDIGKLAVPEHILSKPGPLTHEEFQKVRIHSVVGAEIIAGVPFPHPVAPLILSHHERWNGTGYPAGLKGAEIPIGARILAVVDYFEAMTSERPYHRAVSFDAAVDTLLQESGKALDPTVVARFIKLLPSMREAEATAEGVAAEVAEAPAAPGQDAAAMEGGREPSTVFDEIALAHKEIYSLYELSQAMGTSLKISDSMEMIASKFRNLVPFSACALFLVGKGSEIVRCRFATGVDDGPLKKITVRIGQGNVGLVVTTREPIVNGRPADDFEAAGLPPETMLQSTLMCPLIFSERVIGTLALYHVEARHFTHDHRRLASRVCEQAAAVIYNSMVFQQTQQDSLTDPLTGLPNTRFLYVYLNRELARSARLGTSLALLVADLDNLKDVNDHFGHHVGDRALQEVAGLLKRAIRPYDICVRYGGDEFIVVLSECGADECESRRVELQSAVESVLFEAAVGSRVQLRISVGAAVYPLDGDSYDRLLATADTRMYHDKSLRKSLAAVPGAEGDETATPGVEPLRRAHTRVQ